MTQVSVNSAGSAGSAESADPAEVPDPAEAADQAKVTGPAEAVRLAEAPAPPAPPTIGGLTVPVGPIERVMSWVIRKLAWSRLSHPRVAMAVSGLGLLLSMVVGATAPNHETLPVRLPLSHLLPSLQQNGFLAGALLYTGDVLACLGLAGMLWAHSQGWRPNPRHLLLASAAIVAVMVCLTPVGSSDTASYAAYGRITALGGNPYITNPHAWFGAHSAYYHAVGWSWKHQPSVYGPIATVVQSFAAWIGGASVTATIWVLMIINGIVFIGIGVLLLKTSDDPVRATLFWVANPVLIMQLVSGGHLDTLVAAAAICAIQVARRASGLWGDVLVGVMIGLACGLKANAVLVALGLAWPLLRRHEWMRTARIAAVALVTVGLEYIPYGLSGLKPLFGGLKLVVLPSPWWLLQESATLLGVSKSTIETVISCLWPIALIIVAQLIYKRISSDQPREVVAPFALAFAWILVAPWVFAWYAALAWVALTQVPRNRMTRWLTIVTVVLALWHSSGGQAPSHVMAAHVGHPLPRVGPGH
ncbi:MAG: polyprenol phosphomannose-dependent alpha 1,6 mannosyltransferase MptB [Streptosporangiaceae bacterium]